MSLFTIDYRTASNEDWYDVLDFRNAEDLDEEFDLTGSSFRAHLRTYPERLLVSLDVSTDNGRLLISTPPTDGYLSWNVPRETWADTGIAPGTYVYDMVWTMPDGREVQFASGKIELTLGITRT